MAVEYQVRKKVYRIDFEGETCDGEAVAGTITALTSRSIELQVRHWYPDVSKVTSFSCTTAMCSMGVAAFYASATRTVIS